MFLRQSTASQEILLGPFVDDGDGNTAETGLTIANTDIKVWKHGATTEASKNSGGATHIASGRYYAALDATDTDTLGNLEINVHVAGALAVRRQFTVLHANVYDTLFGSTALSTLTAAQVNTEADTALTDWGKTGFSLASTGLNSVILADPASAPVLGTSTIVQGIAALVCHDASGGIKSFNKTTGVMQQKNAAGTNVWTTTATDDGTTRTIGKAT